jgi:hypothetical protein
VKFHPPWHLKQLPRWPEKKKRSPRFADSEIAVVSPPYRIAIVGGSQRDDRSLE